MTTKILSASYPTGFYLKTPVTVLSITSTGYVGTHGVYTEIAAPNTYTVINDGTLVGGATGVYLGDGGLVTNGSASDTKAFIFGGVGIKLQQAGSVTNFGTINSTMAGGHGIYCNGPGLVTNGSVKDTGAFIGGQVGVLMTGDAGIVGTVDNFGSIEGYAAGSVGVALSSISGLTNGGVSDTTARVTGDYGVVGSAGRAFVTNYGTIVGAGPEASAAGVLFKSGGVVANGSLHDTSALIEGSVTGVQIYGLTGAVNNYGTIDTTAAPSKAAVELDKGGIVTNGAAGDVRAQIVGSEGVLAENAAATVTNFGKIVGLSNTGGGVELNKGGVVVNGSLTDTTALIAGGRGVHLSGAKGTVTNFATISGGARPGYYGSNQYAGVNLFAGGTLTNGATGDAAALIEGYDGVLLAGASRGVNLATIEATGGYGVHLYGASRMTNGSASDHGALIEGWIGAELYDTSALTNFGVVAGAGGVAVSLGAATSRLNAEAGSVFKGVVDAGAGLVDFVGGAIAVSGIQSAGVVEGAGTVELDGGASTFDFGVLLTVARIDVAGAATSVAFGASVTFAKVWDQSAGRLSVAKGNTVTFSGTGDSVSGTLAGPGDVTFTGALANAGVLTVLGGTLTVGGAVTGAGKVLIGGGMADFAGAFTQNVTFTKTTGILELGESQIYTGSIAGFSKTGVTSLDLADIAYVKGKTTAVYKGTTSSGTLTVKEGALTAIIHFAGDYTASKWTLSSDGHGGTKIVDPGGGAPAHTFIAAAAGFGARASGWASLTADAWRTSPAALGAPRAQMA